jgi:prepilin-type N-terminal cleavage/methylation domain-containing protein
MALQVESPMSRRRGFTLIELLVVISVILLLSALILPAIQSSMKTALKASNVNNLRQIHSTVMAYAASYRGLYPALDQSNYLLGGATNWNMPNFVYNFDFMAQLNRLDRRVLFCPADPQSEWHIRMNYAWGNQYALGYTLWCGRSWPAYAQQVGARIPGMSIATTQPTAVLVADLVRLWEGTWVRDGIRINNFLQETSFATAGGHAGFADGSVSWTPATKLNWDIYYKNIPTAAYDRDWVFCAGFQR